MHIKAKINFAYALNHTTQNFKKDVHIWDYVDAICVEYLIVIIYRRWTFVALFPQSTAT